MRTLKFRVWDKSMKRWWCEDSQYLQMDGKKIHPAPWSTLSADLPDEHIVIQQYTGLKDTNGKEIYEGDIVKVYSEEFENENFTGKVIFDEGSFLTWINKNDIRGVWSDDNIEVIGNIFETPELLEA